MLFWWRWKLRSKNPVVRERAARALGKAKDRRAAPLLIQALNDDDSGVRNAVVEALRMLNEGQSLIQALRASLAQRAAAEALGALKEKRAIPDLALALADRRIRISAFSALTEIDPDWRNSAAVREVIPTLVGHLREAAMRRRDSPSSDVRQDASEEMEECAWALHLIGPACLDALLPLLKDEDERLRQTALEVLGALRDTRSFDALVRLLDSSYGAYREALEALVALRVRNLVAAHGLKESFNALDRIRPDWRTSPEVASAVIPLLIEDLAKPNPAIREGATAALGQFRDAGAAQSLRELLQDANAKVRILAASSLAELNDPGAVALLIGALSDPDEEIREAAADELGKLRLPSTVDALIGTLGDSSGKVRRAAVGALGQTRDLRAVEPLIAALEDHEASVAAVIALGEIGDVRAVDGLVAVLERDKSRWKDSGRIVAPALMSICHLRCVRPLVEAVRKGVQPLFSVPALEHVFDRLATQIPEEELRNMLRVPARIALDEADWEEDIPWYECAHLRELALQELIRRGCAV